MPASGILSGLILRGHGPILQSPYLQVIDDKFNTPIALS